MSPYISEDGIAGDNPDDVELHVIFDKPFDGTIGEVVRLSLKEGDVLAVIPANHMPRQALDNLQHACASLFKCKVAIFPPGTRLAIVEKQ